MIEDCDVCAESENCICLVPEFLEHDIPILVISGEDELIGGDLSSDYSGLIGPDIYINTPETTAKIVAKAGTRKPIVVVSARVIKLKPLKKQTIAIAPKSPLKNWSLGVCEKNNVVPILILNVDIKSTAKKALKNTIT